MKQLKLFELQPAPTLAEIGVQGILPSVLDVELKQTEIFNTYWNFAAERQKIFLKKLSNAPQPWTLDPILRLYKFTNVFRATDRVSQYLIKNIIYSGDQSPCELFFRIILFKIFNKIETWEILTKNLGMLTYHDYSFSNYDKVLTAALAEGHRIYSGAYIMPSGRNFSNHSKKHRMHLELLEFMINDSAYNRIAEAKTMKEAFKCLKVYPTIGDFLAYQYIIDINYSTLTNFDENDFIVAGPGAKSGIDKCFLNPKKYSYSDIIKMVTEVQETEFKRLGVNFQNLYGRKLHLIDCQNIFCETDKYARIAHPNINRGSSRTRIKQKFTENKSKISYFFPPKWSINEFIK